MVDQTTTSGSVHLRGLTKSNEAKYLTTTHMSTKRDSDSEDDDDYVPPADVRKSTAFVSLPYERPSHAEPDSSDASDDESELKPVPTSPPLPEGERKK
jgi:hypothetical protein